MVIKTKILKVLSIWAIYKHFAIITKTTNKSSVQISKVWQNKQGLKNNQGLNYYKDY